MREVPKDFQKMLKEFDDTLEARYDPGLHLFQVWRWSRGEWHHILNIEDEDGNPAEPGEWVIEYLRRIDLGRYRSVRDFCRQLRERREERRRRIHAERRDRMEQLVSENWRQIQATFRDDADHHLVRHFERNPLKEA